MTEDSRRNAKSALKHASLWMRVPHDLRQPIQTLMLLARVIADTDDPSERRKITSMMEDLLIALQAMHDQLGLLAQLDARHGRPVCTPCSLPDLVAGAVADIATLAAQRSISVRTKIEPVTVLSDADLVRNVVKDLILVAVKLGTGQQITITSQSHSDGHKLDIDFEGPEIAAAQRATVFIEQPAPLGGIPRPAFAAGLGLIARIAAALGGRLKCKSLSGNIQRFSLTLPIASGGKPKG